MQYLLDTHVVLWWVTEPKKIRPKIQKIIADGKNKIFISSASLWEMAIKKSIGRLTMPHNLIEILISDGFEILPIVAEEALGVADLPLIHLDPFDRLLIIQAKLHDLILITADSKMTEYPVVILEA